MITNDYKRLLMITNDYLMITNDYYMITNDYQ